ncbi:hypothetical protein ADIAL_1614 [Alkalibacterium sp. AK22]|uniref:CamS family sex pheromone protein n=1 Tax=Alkalibacterium sp. AK22 TaxID=1229520 RepID=UPI000451D3B7|nr:CamS family sex pheromone protein [Alkalibacterium sp. AK22]EXJ22991.1 hypothetical protein ADIAL_1614 [Alkalibacterium sp. AK22]
MKRKFLWGSLMTHVLFLTACGLFPDPVDPDQPAQEELEQIEDGETGDEPDEEASIVEVQADSGYFRPVINEDGTYSPSLSRGITRRLNSGVNMRTFESDLMRLSQSFFSTEDHFFQEGQFIPSETISAWLRRQQPVEEETEVDEENEGSEETGEEEESVDLGLNPVDNESMDPSERNPIYLSSILEHNFYVQTENGLELSGVSIGLAMNSVDYFGPQGELEQTVSTEELLEEGQRMSNEIISQMREMEGLEEVPIMIGLFEQSRQDNLAPGTYIAQAISENGNTSASSWRRINERRVVFPLEGMQSAEGNSFANFRSEVEGFFPNISGVTGTAHYIEEQLVDLQINMMTQFYGKGEIIAFTQFINEAATNFLPQDVPVEIRVESLNGMESFLYKDADQDEFEVYIFN